MKKEEYIPDLCEHCGQSTTYLLAVDRGTVDILKQIARFVGKKGINVVHPRKEMEGEYLTSNQVGNLSRPRFHGLIARYKDEAGNYVLTRKGADFLKGGRIPKFAIISKSEGKQIGYWKPEEYECSVGDFSNADEYWEGINYEIQEGKVIRNENPIQTTLL